MSDEIAATPPEVVYEFPMGPTPDKSPRIKVVFRGFIIADITAELATIGAIHPTLKDGPCHAPIVHVFAISPKERGEVSEDITNQLGFDIKVAEGFSLKVTPGPKKVQIFWKDEQEFNRLDEVGNNKKDFRWFVDANEIHKRIDPKDRVIIDLKTLAPTFTLNTGIFHSSKLSDGEVRIERLSKKKRFGRFSTEITARISLDKLQLAHFTNGAEKIYTIPNPKRPDYRYEIVFDCTCRSADEEESDLGLIYVNGIVLEKDGTGIKEQVKLEPFGEPREERLTPEVYCFGLNAGPTPTVKLGEVGSTRVASE
ncbi:MAG: hypothetical protein AABN34_07960 [Acidobacteriota bacterium]